MGFRTHSSQAHVVFPLFSFHPVRNFDDAGFFLGFSSDISKLAVLWKVESHFFLSTFLFFDFDLLLLFFWVFCFVLRQCLVSLRPTLNFLHSPGNESVLLLFPLLPPRCWGYGFSSLCSMHNSFSMNCKMLIILAGILSNSLHYNYTLLIFDLLLPNSHTGLFLQVVFMLATYAQFVLRFA